MAWFNAIKMVLRVDVFRCLTAFVGVYWIGVRRTSVIVGCTFVRGLLDPRPTLLRFDLPQGSVLGPIPFLLYTAL